MSTMYVSWHKWYRRGVNVALLQVEGPFISSESVDISGSGDDSDIAPDDADYATVWADVPFYFKNGTGAATDSTSKPYPAYIPVQIVNVTPGETVISGVAL